MIERAESGIDSIAYTCKAQKVFSDCCQSYNEICTRPNLDEAITLYLDYGDTDRSRRSTNQASICSSEVGGAYSHVERMWSGSIALFEQNLLLSIQTEFPVRFVHNVSGDTGCFMLTSCWLLMYTCSETCSETCSTLDLNQIKRLAMYFSQVMRLRWYILTQLSCSIARANIKVFTHA